MRLIKRLLQKVLSENAYNNLRGGSHSIRRKFIHSSWPFIDLVDRTRRAGRVSRPYPPARLRHRVNGTHSLKSFVRIGERCLDDMENTLRTCGRRLDSFANILDFGCGCGRILIPTLARYPAMRVFGTDNDGDAIAWCRSHLPDGTFNVNEPVPPTGYAGNYFDFVFAISVFTHLDEGFQFQWLEELNRITALGGFVLLTVNGANVVSRDLAWLDAPRRSALAANRHLFLKTEVVGEKGYPEWYQSAVHTEAYVRDHFSRFFAVVKQIPKGMADDQDILVLQKTESRGRKREPLPPTAFPPIPRRRAGERPG